MADGLDHPWRGQHIESIPLESLVLWSENPRDPIDADATNEEIIENALHGVGANTKWKLEKLAKEMGDIYDLSQLPTVAPGKEDGKYVVYDGNRRVMLAMLREWGSASPLSRTRLPLYPESIPCNVCEREVAIKLVYRRHAERGTWGAYERDVFASKHMGEPKSVLVRIEELVRAISRFPSLDKRYVGEDILNDKHLREFGLDPAKSDYGVSSDMLLELLECIASGVESGSLNTRGQRNDPAKVVPEELIARIKADRVGREARTIEDGDGVRTVPPSRFATDGEQKEGADNQEQAPLFAENASGRVGSPLGDTGVGDARTDTVGVPRRTPSVSTKLLPVFGGRLSLRSGGVNNLYRTLEDLWGMNERDRIPHPEGFVGVFRMGLRLLAETASKDCFPGERKPLDRYVTKFAGSAKKGLRSREGGRDIATFLHAQSVDENRITNLLQSGAHSYSSSNSKEQTLAMSILLGEMLRLSHGK